jgi:hypothetical protein
MDNAKFTYFDIISYIIPGAVTFLILFWFITGFLVFPFTVGKDVTDGVAILIILVAGYFLGHVVHAIGAMLLKDREMRLKLCKEYLQDKKVDQGPHYTKVYKYHLASIFVQKFGLQNSELEQPLAKLTPKLTPSEYLEYLKNLNEEQLTELFYLSQAQIREANMASYTDTLEAIGNMYRGMYACAWVSAIVCFLISLKQLFLVLFTTMLPGVLPTLPFFALKLPQLFLGIFLTMLFIIAAVVLFQPRWRRYKEYFVDSLFTNLHIWYQTQQDKGKSDRAGQ